MASSRRLKKLDCFYCGIKSGVVQDGTLQSFDCRHCLSTNYVDQNGDILDPPAEVFSADASPPPTSRYAQQIAEPVYDSRATNQPTDELFCKTCQKNQHMYQSFISSYDPDHVARDDTRSQSPDKRFLAYKKDMQQRYPQVCADCKRGVEDRIRKANRMAQADVLRHKLDRTKTKHSTTRTRSWLEFFSLWGGVVYWAATLAQSLVCLLGLLHGVLPRLCQAYESEPFTTEDALDPDHTSRFASIISISACAIQKLLYYSQSSTSRLPSLGFLSLTLTLASFWWNPYFRNMIRGFDRHIHGFVDWYKYQAILLVTRVVFWTMMGKGQLSYAEAPPTMGAYCFMLAFTLLIARISRQSIQVDFRKLFSNVRDPEWEESPVAQTARTSVYRSNSLLDALNETSTSPSNSRSPLSFPSTSGASAFQIDAHDRPQRPAASSPIQMPPSQHSLADMSEQEAIDHLLGSDMTGNPQGGYSDDRMDWTPSGSSRFTDFRPNIQRPIQSTLPVLPKDPKPFWYKLPAAPKNQTNKPLDPFRKPIFEAASAEKKENFFNSMTGRVPAMGQQSNAEEKREIQMAPPKFFAQKSFESTGLEDLMEKAFTIKGGDTPGKPLSRGVFERAVTPPSPTLTRPGSVLAEVLPSTMAQGQSGGWKTHIAYIIGLSLAFAVWHDTFNQSRLETKQTAIGIMIVLMARALRILTDNTVTDWAKRNAGLRTAIATTFGGLEAAFATYLGLEIWGTQRFGPGLQSKGSGLIGGMLIQEVWFLFY